MSYLKVIILIILFLSNSIYSQTPPSDFKLVGSAGGLAPWTVSETITISANGQVNFFRFKGGSSTQILLDTNFTIAASKVQQLWQSIQDNSFFSLNSNYQDELFREGSFAVFTITANNTTNQVVVKNAAQNSIENIIASVNSNLPPEYKLDYIPPEKIDIVPVDPCGRSLSVHIPLKENSTGKYYSKTTEDYNSVSSVKDEIQIPHGGVGIGYEMSLYQAVVSGRAILKSKGEFFGDGVSVTGDNTGTFPPEDITTIKVNLNLEFYGPCDNAANESKIISDILNKWDGQTTSDGKEIKMEIFSLSHPGVLSPPGTPGYDNIKLECGDGVSVCDGLGSPNSDEVLGGTWYPSDEPGTFGHEAGHLMGIDDHYTDWKKLPDGDWQSIEGGQPLSNSDFTDLFNSRWGENIPPDEIAKNSLISIPSADFVDDVMGNSSKSPLKTIDSLADAAGLIISINPGDVFTDSHNFHQSLAVTRKGDLYLKYGEKKTLNGIYTACIDGAAIPPSKDAVLDVAPSLDKWNGVPAAKYLSKLLHYIDSMGYYCSNWGDAQLAVWRITNNSSGGSKLVDSMFKYSGLDLGNQVLYFPKLENIYPADTISQGVVPNELFIPDIQPKSVQAGIGQNLSFNASVMKPVGFDYPADISWNLNTPEGSSSQITSNGSFTPDQKGIYTVSVNINITKSPNISSEYTPDKKSFAVVPDKFTETFEHPSLSDLFQWKTYGVTGWEITNSDAQSGSYSIKPGDVTRGDSSILEINVNLPKDDSITFALKALTNYSAILIFEVDGIKIDSWQKSTDWQILKYNLNSGEHKLRWAYRNNNVINPSIVWLDNIFFPENSVVTGINELEENPLLFTLYQNYPNPFNPKTTIKYSIPKEGFVKINVYNVIGKEIAILENETKQPGNYEIDFNAENYPSGVYFYKLQVGDFVQTKKMILLK